MSNSPLQYEKGMYVGTKIRERMLGHIITSETVFAPHLCSAWHYHANPHFSHILSGGSTEVRKGGSEIQAAGTGLYYYPGIAHRNVDYRAGTRIFNLELGEGFFREFGLAPPPASLMFAYNSRLNTDGLLRIMKEHYLHDADSLLAITQLCIHLVQALDKNEKCCPEWAEKIKTLINDSWNQPLTLATLSAQLDIHPVTVSKYFPRYFGCSLGEYRRRIRVERALSLVRSTQQSLTRIAYECGFTDQAHFTKTFRHITGLLPKHYRNM